MIAVIEATWLCVCIGYCFGKGLAALAGWL
jgi:hypothetical protein